MSVMGSLICEIKICRHAMLVLKLHTNEDGVSYQT